ncbi:MAG: IS30 family transposase, partial [Balneolaceae bacterium]
ETEKLSPELISGRWAVRGVDGVSHEAIYQWIWRGKRQKDPATKELYTHLKHGRRRRKRGNYNDTRGILTERTSIEQRPKVVNERSRLGDVEIVLMVGKAHKSALVVITDRATLLTSLKKITSRHAELTKLAIEQSLARNSQVIH